MRLVPVATKKCFVQVLAHLVELLFAGHAGIAAALGGLARQALAWRALLKCAIDVLGQLHQAARITRVRSRPGAHPLHIFSARPGDGAVLERLAGHGCPTRAVRLWHVCYDLRPRAKSTTSKGKAVERRGKDG